MRIDRRAVVGLVVLLIAVAVMAPSGGTAQDTTEPRLAALETQVADLSTRVDVLEGGGTGGGTDVGTPSADGLVEVTGEGTVVTDPFKLGEGNYRVTMTLETAESYAFSFVIYDEAGDPEYLGSNYVEDGGEWSQETVFRAGPGGDFYIEVEVTEPSTWSVVFEPI